MEVFIIDSMDPSNTKAGGVEVYVINLIYFLLKQSVNTTLIGVTQDKKRSSFNYPFKFIYVAKGQKISNYKFLFRLLLKTITFKVSNTAIIHAQRPDFIFPFSLFYRKNLKVCTLHGTPGKAIFFKKNVFIGSIYYLIEKFTLKRTDKVIAVNEDTKAFYSKKYPWLKNKIVIIPIGIDLNKFKPMDKMEVREKYGFSKSNKIIMYVGRLEKEKALDLLLKAFKDVKNKVKNVKLILVGDGREKEYLENVAKELKLKEVRFMGALEHDRIPEIMNCADVFALTSLYEGSPTVLKEALACGIPVISTDVGDVRDYVIDNKTGYLIKNHDYENISKLLIRCLEKGECMKENCVKIAQKYSWDKIAERTMEVYRNV